MPIIKKLGVLTGLLVIAGTLFAQTEKDATVSFYRLDFVTREMDDTKLVNSRNYSIIVSDKGGEGGNSIRTGSRIPVATQANPTQFNYIDLGIAIDTRNVREVAGQLNLTITADINSAAESTSPSPLPPVIRQYKWNSSVTVPLRKATQVYSSDDLGSKRKFQLELTATPIK